MRSIDAIKQRCESAIKRANNLVDLERLEIEYVGRKGELTTILRSLKNKSEEERKKIGKEANDLKEELKRRFAKLRRELEKELPGLRLKKERLDVTAPGIRRLVGGVHPITVTLRDVCRIFSTMGFAVAEGPEVETEWYNFDALNIPADHPAREMWDTFWLKPTNQKSKIKNQKLLLRTHTSPVQIRFMQTHKPPFKIISPGRVFRYEATDATHDFQLWMLEGLVVGREVSVANFKSVMEVFFKELLGSGVEARLRPSYFPFTEPSFEVDMRRGGGSWLEVFGAGMVHPQVLRNCGINPNEWQGFAFGGGIDRLAMLKYKIPDIRLFREDDIRLLRQFRRAS
ncbi:MAG TPA: phenylalanine--tRNA ligase subunit alpha [Candidatus Paceibacterota bacterium]